MLINPHVKLPICSKRRMVGSLPEWMGQKLANCLLTTKTIFPKRLKSRNSRSELEKNGEPTPERTWEKWKMGEALLSFKTNKSILKRRHKSQYVQLHVPSSFTPKVVGFVWDPFKTTKGATLRKEERERERERQTNMPISMFGVYCWWGESERGGRGQWT